MSKWQSTIILREINPIYDNGGDSTIRSFERNNDCLENYIEVFSQMPVYIEDEHYVFVHAGVKPRVVLGGTSYVMSFVVVPPRVQVPLFYSNELQMRTLAFWSCLIAMNLGI